MSPAHQDSDSRTRPGTRPRSSTVQNMLWRRNRPDTTSAPSPVSTPAAPVQTQTLSMLLSSLTPPAVDQSLAHTHAHALVEALRIHAPPQPSSIIPILNGLCGPSSPPSFQTDGYIILTTYCRAVADVKEFNLTTGERLALIQVFRSQMPAWSQDIWEARLNALTALINEAGDEIAGLDAQIRDLLVGWIDSAFEGLLVYSAADRLVRERAVDALTEYLNDWQQKPLVSARSSEENIMELFNFFANMVNRAIRLPIDAFTATSPPATPLREAPQRHKRNVSSLSGVQSPSVDPSPPSPPQKHPLYVAANIYLNNLDIQLHSLPASYLSTLLPTLLRLLSACMSPLPVHSVDSERQPSADSFDIQDLKASLEDRITKTIKSILGGQYSSISIVLLKRHLFPPASSQNERQSSIPYPKLPPDILAEACPGAHRILRLQIRSKLADQLSAERIMNMYTDSASPSGVPGVMQAFEHLERGAQRAWRREKDEGVVWNLWDARKVGIILQEAVRSWSTWSGTEASAADEDAKWREEKIKEKVFEEIVYTLRDVLQYMDDSASNQKERNDENASQTVESEERAHAAGSILNELVKVVIGSKNIDGTLLILPIEQPLSAPTPFLRTLCGILGRMATRPVLTPALPLIQLVISQHLTDEYTEKIPNSMYDLQLLSPISHDWLDNWEKLLSSPAWHGPGRLATRRAIHNVLLKVHNSLIDMPIYRRELTRMSYPYWKMLVEEDFTETNEDGTASGIWRIVIDEVILRVFENDDAASLGSANEMWTSVPKVEDILDSLMEAAKRPDPLPKENVAEGNVSRQNQASPETNTAGTPNTSFSPATSSYPPSNTGSPTLSRSVTEKGGHIRDRESSIQIPQFMSLISSFTTGNPSRMQNAQTTASPMEEVGPSMTTLPSTQLPADPILMPVSIMATTVLVEIFTRLSFSDRIPGPRQGELSNKFFDKLLSLLRDAQSSRARIVLLQCLLRLRGDRDHHVFLLSDPSRYDTQITTLASLIGRNTEVAFKSEEKGFDEIPDPNDNVRARSKPVIERDGRRTSRGRGSKTPNPTSSRSRSRATTSKPLIKSKRLWSIPETVPFSLDSDHKISEALITYDPDGPDRRPVLDVASYLEVLGDILLTHSDWEVISYILVYLPGQLANKHFWCGPLTRRRLSNLCAELCKSVLQGDFGKSVPQEQWQNTGLKARDAQGLLYHLLTVMISYQQILELSLRHSLVDVFLGGLSSIPSSVKCCLHALSLCAYEMQPSMSRQLPRILEKLSQIMTNPSMAVYILAFLSIVASLPSLYANFTESDFKTVFGVALQYLQHHNREETSAQISFALSEHVRVMSFHLVYVWFLALKLPDRPKHVKFIGRQLLLANEGREEVDEPTEVCFDWLARYTYASADPKPASSLLSEIVSDVEDGKLDAQSHTEKSWILGHSIVTIKTLAKAGWIEVSSRRASGFTKFLCKSENIPFVGPGDVNPDTTTIPASLMMDRRSEIVLPRSLRTPDVSAAGELTDRDLRAMLNPSDVFKESTSIPDPITGYVWSSSAPSQRRKVVDLDPSYFALQLSAYPDINQSMLHQKVIRDSTALNRFVPIMDLIPVIDTHKVGILYVAPGQTTEEQILRNTHGSPAYTRFLEGIGRLLKIRGQLDVYVGGLDPDFDGEYAYAWWDDIGQILYHTATLMPNQDNDEKCTIKKSHIGNDYVRIVWNDSGFPYKFDTLSTDFQFVNIVIEPHSYGPVAAFSNNLHENEYFKVTVQRAPDMAEFTAVGDYKIISANSLPAMVRQLSLLADWYASVFSKTGRGIKHEEFITNWRARLQKIKRFAATIPENVSQTDSSSGIMGQEAARDFTTSY